MKVFEILHEEESKGTKSLAAVRAYASRMKELHPLLTIDAMLHLGDDYPTSRFFSVTVMEKKNNSLSKLTDDPVMQAKIAARQKTSELKPVDAALEIIKIVQELHEVDRIEVSNTSDRTQFSGIKKITRANVEEHFHDKRNIYGVPFVSLIFWFNKPVKEALGIYSKKKKEQEQIDPKVVKKIQKKAPKTANGKKPLER